MVSPQKKSLLLGHFFPYLMANLAKRISDSCASIYNQQFELSIPEWRIVASLAESERQNSLELAHLTFMDKSKVSRAVKVLDSKGYLCKERDEDDNRVTYLTLSAKGKKLYHRIAPQALAWEGKLLEVLDVTEYRDLIRIIQKLDQRLDVIDQQA